MSERLKRLLPQPQQARITCSGLPLTGDVELIAEAPPEQIGPAVQAATELLAAHGLPAPTGSASRAARLQFVDDDSVGCDASYRLRLDAHGIRIEAAGAHGHFYAIQTLAQWVRLHVGHPGQPNDGVPGVEILDGPAIGERGVLLDISRNKVPTMRTLFELVDRLANWKINQLQLYTEHTFAYEAHEVVWREASPLTPAQIRSLDAYCADRLIELLPNQNSFGHMHRWLVHEPYRKLAECPEGIEHPFSRRREPFSLCPTDPGSLKLLRDLYSQLLPNFSSGRFNVGLDETFDLGSGRSASACAERGKAAVYLEFLLAVHGLAAEHGKTIQYWADIVLNHPETLARLPEDATALLWGYEADHPFDEQAKQLRDAGLSYYVCPGTSSWNSFAGRADNALGNLLAAANAAVEHGAAGYLVTDWGDNGHLQPLAASQLGMLAGAYFAWNPEARRTLGDWPELLDWHAFDAPGSGLGHAAIELGNAYLPTGSLPKNGTVLFHLLLSSQDGLDHPRYRGLSSKGLASTLQSIQAVLDRLASMRLVGGADQSRRELIWAGQALRLGAQVGLARHRQNAPDPRPEFDSLQLRRDLNALREDLSTIWLARNRQGGLSDSLALLSTAEESMFLKDS